PGQSGRGPSDFAAPPGSGDTAAALAATRLTVRGRASNLLLPGGRRGGPRPAGSWGAGGPGVCMGARANPEGGGARAARGRASHPGPSHDSALRSLDWAVLLSVLPTGDETTGIKEMFHAGRWFL